MIVTCLHCQKEFDKKPHEIKKSPNHYCSRSCAAKEANKTPKRKKTKKCSQCDTLILSQQTRCPECVAAGINLKCVECNSPFVSSRQKKFCSIACKSKHHQQNSYESQQARGQKRKLELIKDKGGGCSNCGYNKNYSVLEFHHVDESTKSFNLDLRSLSNRAMSKIKDEADKCILLCANCHREHHNPQCKM